MSDSFLATTPGTSWRRGQLGQPDLCVGVLWPAQAAAVQATQPAGLPLLWQREGKG